MQVKELKYKIRALRVGQGIKATQFAEDLGISREYLRQIENGMAKNPNLELIKKMSKLLNSTPQELFFGE